MERPKLFGPGLLCGSIVHCQCTRHALAALLPSEKDICLRWTPTGSDSGTHRPVTSAIWGVTTVGLAVFAEAEILLIFFDGSFVAVYAHNVDCGRMTQFFPETFGGLRVLLANRPTIASSSSKEIGNEVGISA